MEEPKSNDENIKESDNFLIPQYKIIIKNIMKNIFYIFYKS